MRIRITPGFWTSRVGLVILGSVLLLFVVAIPFATATVADYLSVPSDDTPVAMMR